MHFVQFDAAHSRSKFDQNVYNFSFFLQPVELPLRYPSGLRPTGAIF
jgi:hypothetical protein